MTTKTKSAIFADWEVRAFAEGRKTQFRRVVKPQPGPEADIVPFEGRFIFAGMVSDIPKNYRDGFLESPYVPGDVIRVKEAYGFSHQDDDINEIERVVCYRAGYPYHVTDSGVDQLKRCRSGELMQPNHFVADPAKWRSATTMPAWASRFYIEVVSVRVERLQEISEADAVAEGVLEMCVLPGDRGSFVQPFAYQWESDHGPSSWAANPWVWVVEFKRIEQGAA